MGGAPVDGSAGRADRFLIVVNIFIFFLAFFLDFFEIAFIILPLLGPVADKLGIDLIWFGVMLCVNMQTSFMHPLSALRCSIFEASPTRCSRTTSFLPGSSHGTSTWGRYPSFVLQLILVAIVIAFPQTVTALLEKPALLDVDKVVIPVTPDFDDAPVDQPGSARRRGRPPAAGESK